MTSDIKRTLGRNKRSAESKRGPPNGIRFAKRRWGELILGRERSIRDIE